MPMMLDKTKVKGKDEGRIKAGQGEEQRRGRRQDGAKD